MHYSLTQSKAVKRSAELRRASADGERVCCGSTARRPFIRSSRLFLPNDFEKEAGVVVPCVGSKERPPQGHLLPKAWPESVVTLRVKNELHNSDALDSVVIGRRLRHTGCTHRAP